MYKINVLNFIINTTGVVYDMKGDVNQFIRENLPDAFDMFINIMGGKIENFREHYILDEPVTDIQQMSIELMATYLGERKPNITSSIEAKNYLEKGREQFIEDLNRPRYTYEYSYSSSGSGFDREEVPSSDLERCLDTIIHYGMMCNQ